MREATAEMTLHTSDHITSPQSRFRSLGSADHLFPRSALIGRQSFQLEGLAVAIPWGFESPFRTKTHRGPVGLFIMRF